MRSSHQTVRALDVIVSLAFAGDGIPDGDLITADCALIIDTPDRPGLILEGTTTELLRLLDSAHLTVSTYNRAPFTYNRDPSIALQ